MTGTSSSSAVDSLANSSMPCAFLLKTMSSIGVSGCMALLYSPVHLLSMCEFNSQLKSTHLQNAFANATKTKGPTATQQVEPLSVRMWTHPDTGNTSLRYQNPAASAISERHERRYSRGHWCLPFRKANNVPPNPGADPPPVNLARDTRKGLYLQWSCRTGKPSTGASFKITGKGRFYGKIS